MVVQRGYFGVVPEREREQRRGQDQRGSDQDRTGPRRDLPSGQRENGAGEQCEEKYTALLEGERERRGGERHLAGRIRSKLICGTRVVRSRRSKWTCTTYVPLGSSAPVALRPFQGNRSVRR
jgi:hypothetical protein